MTRWFVTRPSWLVDAHTPPRPTSGVTLENVAEYLEAGAFAVGFVKSLFEPEDIAAGRFDVIENRAREMLRAAAVAP